MLDPLNASPQHFPLKCLSDVQLSQQLSVPLRRPFSQAAFFPCCTERPCTRQESGSEKSQKVEVLGAGPGEVSIVQVLCLSSSLIPPGSRLKAEG